MAGYQRFATPRAYVDLINFHLAIGTYGLSNITIVDDTDRAVSFTEGSKEDLFDLKPHNYVKVASGTQQFFITLNNSFSTNALQVQNFIAILGHNFYDATAIFKIQVSDTADFSSGVTTITPANTTLAINAPVDSDDSNYFEPTLNGWSLITFAAQTGVGNQYLRITLQDENNTTTNFNSDLMMGSIMFGTYVDWPHAPQISLTTAYDYDGTTLHNSAGGSSYANAPYFGAPIWSATQPFMNTTSNAETYPWSGRKGRMRHSLNFSHISDSNLFHSNQHDYYDMYAVGSDLHSQFYNKIIGQHNPFLFTIDKTSTTTGDYGLYRLADNSFEAKQIGSRVWNVNLDLIESW